MRGWNILITRWSIHDANRHLDWALDVIHVLQVFAIAATIVPVVYALGAWFSKRRWKWNRLFDTLTAAACVGFLWILYVVISFILGRSIRGVEFGDI